MENFLQQDFIPDLTLCDELIDYHKNSEYKHEGLITGLGLSGAVDKKRKDSMDVSLYDTKLKNKFFVILQEQLEKYMKTFEFSNYNAAFNVIENINIQHYKPGGGYHDWHCERPNARGLTASRHLVYMIYLNDVNDGGETEFYYQKLKVKPRKGLALIWPADWTYTHRGIPSNTEEKYIITGWYNYIA